MTSQIVIDHVLNRVLEEVMEGEAESIEEAKTSIQCSAVLIATELSESYLSNLEMSSTDPIEEAKTYRACRFTLDVVIDAAMKIVETNDPHERYGIYQTLSVLLTGKTEDATHD